jgi:hypothetical protein
VIRVDGRRNDVDHLIHRSESAHNSSVALRLATKPG